MGLNKILILTSGSVSRLDNFKNYPNVVLGSFRDINFIVGKPEIYFLNQNLNEFKAIYFRFVGKSLEIGSIVAAYAKNNNIKIIDAVYESGSLMASSLGKSLELIKLANAHIPLPKTVFGLQSGHEGFDKLNFPYVVKSTTGQRGREVWLVRDEKELADLKLKLNKHKYYFAQELIIGAQRIRALVVGNKVVGAIIRQTKWNRDETKEVINPIPKEVEELAVKTAKAADLDICGVDILTNNTGNYWVIEANAAPSWKLINDNCGIKVEDEIVKYIQGKI